MPVPKWKEKINEVETKADSGADDLLEKARSSKLALVFLLGIAAIIVMLLMAQL